jgi:hypothetical protein
VLLHTELAAVGSAALERVVPQDDHVAPPGALQGRSERGHDLLLRVRGAGGSGVLGAAVGLEPPLRVERHEAQALAGVHDLRARAAVVGQEGHARAAALLDPLLLPAHRRPSVLSAPCPVVVAGDEHDARPGVLDGVHLVVDPAGHLREPGVVGAGKPS